MLHDWSIGVLVLVHGAVRLMKGMVKVSSSKSKSSSSSSDNLMAVNLFEFLRMFWTICKRGGR